MKDNITGKGMDIPMLGIRRAVNEIWNTKKDHLSEEEIQATAHLKALFDDPVFDTANDFKLSTSQVRSLWYIYFIGLYILSITSFKFITLFIIGNNNVEKFFCRIWSCDS